MVRMIWRRLDLPGHDAAFLRPQAGGTGLSGMAVFHEGEPTGLAYSVRCDASWRPLEAEVRGWRGPEAIDLHLCRDAGDGWTRNGVPRPAVAGCVDLDLAFTPATNLLHIRRLGLQVGQEAELRSAWLMWPETRLEPLVQRYRRRGPAEYDYEADVPDGAPFRALLRVDRDGWVLDYPGLWRAE